MPALAITGAVVAIVVLLPVRIALQHRWTGSSGIAVARAAPGPPRRAVALLGIGTLLTALGPLLHLIGLDWAWTPGDAFLVHTVGIVLLVAGTAWASWAQVTMREAWRLGQDESETLRLITSGPFTRVRHPIYSGLVVVALGVTLIDPTPIGFVGALVLALGVVLQAIQVEEPRMLVVHGRDYVDWAARTGRFLPRLR